MKKQCKNCLAYTECKNSVWSWFFLSIGIIATIAIRLVTLVLSFGQFWSKLFWYVGVTGFFVYFLYKFKQDRIVRNNLIQIGVTKKIAQKQLLNPNDYEFLQATLCRIHSSKDLINYFVIFTSSGIVLLLALYQDFIKG